MPQHNSILWIVLAVMLVALIAQVLTALPIVGIACIGAMIYFVRNPKIPR